MKTVTVREVQHDFERVLAWVEAGEAVEVVRRGKVVVRLVPPESEPIAAPDFVGRARRVWGAKPKGARISKVVSDARGEG